MDTQTAAVALASVFFFTIAAWAQTIRIPDFRQQPAPAVLKPGEACNDCGRILSIREIQVDRKPAVPAAFQSATPGSSPTGGERNLVGAVIYVPLGSDTSERPFVGGVGTPEMRERFRETTYEIAVRLDDGTTRVISRPDGTRFRVGDRVRLSGVDVLDLIYE
jgi:outer membrane lipoprotein SlyB